MGGLISQLLYFKTRCFEVAWSPFGYPRTPRNIRMADSFCGISNIVQTSQKEFGSKTES